MEVMRFDKKIDFAHNLVSRKKIHSLLARKKRSPKSSTKHLTDNSQATFTIQREKKPECGLFKKSMESSATFTVLKKEKEFSQTFIIFTLYQALH